MAGVLTIVEDPHVLHSCQSKPSSIDQPSLVVSDSTISRVTSGERVSESTSPEEIGFQDPSVVSKTIAPGSVSIAGMDPSTKKYRTLLREGSFFLFPTIVLPWRALSEQNLLRRAGHPFSFWG
jgi:hypothetical protein